MKKFLYKLTTFLIVFFIILSFETVFAKTNIENSIKKVEYSEEYKNWLKLSDEEKSKVLMPRMYDIKANKTNEQYINSIPNILKRSTLLKARIMNKFDLRTEIPSNVKIRNQMETNECWAFATLGALESHLGLRDKLTNKASVAYDYSEQHMAYATSKEMFKDNKINENGFPKTVSDGGNCYNAHAYLTNGSGAVTETEVPFTNTQELIDISEIQNKNVSTTVFDTIEFETPKTEEQRQEVMKKMKEHISNYGGIYAGIHGASLVSDSYNNLTGAIYCSDATTDPMDHAVTIIGWDDTYNKNNFNEKNQPKNNGAWIIKNSWGEEQRMSLQEVKQNLYEANKTYLNSQEIDSPTKIPNQLVISFFEEDQKYGEGKVSIEEDEVILQIGNNGYMYISYEDVNVYTSLYGIEKAIATKDYDNIYQYDVLGSSMSISLESNEDLYIANVFKRDATEKEKIDKVSIYTYQGYNCEVYVNPNGDNMNFNNFQKVQLAEGNNESIDAGYHTLEFANPIELTGNKFVVAVKLISADSPKTVALEAKVDNTDWKEAIVNEGESFMALESDVKNNAWQDIATLQNKELQGNACIKAFTKKEGSGVTKNVTKIEISTLPTKKEYIQNKENLDLTSGTIKVTYDDGSNEIISMSDSAVTVSGFDNKQIGTKTITVTYKGKTTTFTVQIKAKSSKSQEPTSSNFDKSVANMTNAQIYFYSSDIDKSYVKANIKVSNIKIGSEDNKYTYYYYLSGTKGNKDIKWQKATAQKEKDGTYSITINLDTRNIENINEISESDNLYIYIKEIAELNSKKVEKQHTLQVNSEQTADFYIDGKKVDNLNNIFEYENTQAQPGKNPDTTTAPMTIPQTGIVSITIIAILAIAVIGGYSYYRYKNIDK